MSATTFACGPIRYAEEQPVDGWLTAAALPSEPADRTASLRVVDLSPLGKVSVLAEPAGSFADELGVDAGAVELFDDGLLVAGVGPGEWLALTPGSADTLARQLRQLAPDDDVVTVDLTHGLGAFRIVGRAVSTLLARLTARPVDDARLPDASAQVTLVGGARALLVRDDLLASGAAADLAPMPDHATGDAGLLPSVIIVCDRSQASSVYQAVRLAGDDLGLRDEAYASYRSQHSDA